SAEARAIAERRFMIVPHYCPVKNLGNSIGYRLVQLRNSRPRERMPSGSRSFQKPPPKRPAAMCREAPPAGAVCARSQPAHRPKRSVLPVFMTNPSPRHRRGEPPAIQIRPSNEVLKTPVRQGLTGKLGSTNRTLVYADSCRFGHTFRGSFGFTIESPVIPNIEPTLPQIEQPAPFERRVMQRFAHAVRVVSEAVRSDDQS